MLIWSKPIPKHALILLLCASLLLDLSGCTRGHLRSAPAEVAPDLTDKQSIIAITTKRGEVVEFDVPMVEGAWGGAYPRRTYAFVRNDSILGTVDKTPYAIALSNVQHLWIRVEEVDPYLTTAAVIAGVLAVAGILVMIAAASYEDENTGGSCPFVYSWDGNRYVFDAEPYAGAITRGLERDDFTALENLQATDGSYRLRLANEMPETDHTNSVELLLLDHAPGQRVAADASGRFHDITAARPLLAATDATGQDLRPWLAATDKLIWEAPPEETGDGRVRTEIVLTFPRPAGSEQANLVANGSTGTWGAWMIGEFLALRGNQLPWFYGAIDGVPAAQESLRAWNEREELFVLKVEVEETDGWQVRGFLPGGGRAPENTVVPLDIRRVQGEELRLRLRPPVGFWALNSFAVDYSPAGPPLDLQVVKPTSAVDHQGHDVLSQLLAADEDYHVMPETGDWAHLVFPAPALEPGRARSIFLHSRGYYRLHLAAEHAPDAARLEQIANVPDAATRFAVERFATLRAERAQRR